MGGQFHIYPEVRHGNAWEFAGTFCDQGLQGFNRIPNSLVDDPCAFVAAVMGARHGRKSVKTIAPLRGLPPDLSRHIREWIDYLSTFAEIEEAGWLLLSELLVFDWHGTLDRREWREDGMPELLFPHMQWPPSPGTPPRQPTAEETLIIYAARVEPFVSMALPQLRALGESQNVRVVFFWEYS